MAMVVSCGSSTASSTGGDAWTIWASNTSCTSSTVSNTIISNTGAVWVIWATTSNTSSITNFYYPPPIVPVANPISVEQQQAAEAQRKQAEQERKAAQVKAMELLRANLSQKQRDDLDKRNWFLVEGGKSKKTYRISGRSYAGNITELQGDKEVARYCVHAEWQIPLGDQLLAQALYLRLDEEYIIGKANRTALAA